MTCTPNISNPFSPKEAEASLHFLCQNNKKKKKRALLVFPNSPLVLLDSPSHSTPSPKWGESHPHQQPLFLFLSCRNFETERRKPANDPSRNKFKPLLEIYCLCRVLMHKIMLLSHFKMHRNAVGSLAHFLIFF